MMDETLERLEDIQATIEDLDRQRAAMVHALDEEITKARHGGVAWPRINEACGTTNIQVSWQRRQDRNSFE